MSEVTRRYEQAAGLVKTDGILSIIFGSLGAFFGLLFMLLFAVSLATSYNTEDVVGYFILFILTIFFWVLPHVYLIIAGVTLVKLPEPKVVKTLTIINVVLGALVNLILLIIGIVSLTQSRDYEEGYAHAHHHKK